MHYFSQATFDLRLEWGMPAIAHLAEDVDCIVIIDVMSFSTCVSVANDNGARIYPYPRKDASAKEYGEKRGAVTAHFERRQDSTCYTLSPVSLRKTGQGERVVLPSPNGSAISFRARETGAAIFSGCFRNRTATAAACRHFQRVLLVPCGEQWPDGGLRPSVEDYIAAGSIIEAIGRDNCSPESLAALAAWQHYRQQNPGLLAECSSACELHERGFGEDVALCLETDRSSLACRLYGEYYASYLP